MLRLLSKKIMNASRATKLNYKKTADNHPYLLDSIQVSALMGVGDVITQKFVDKRKANEISWERTLQFAGVGLVFVGPFLRFWFTKLDKIVSPNQSVLKRTTKKVFLDQFIVDPPFLVVFTIILSSVQGMNVSQIHDRLRSDYIPLLKMNLTVWPLAQFINFALVPLRFQVIFIEFISIFWNAYLSFKLN